MPASPISSDCDFCGAYPVNHPMKYIDSCIGLLPALLAPSPTTATPRFLQIFRSPIVRFICRTLITIAAALGLIRFSSVIDDEVTARSRVVWEEAERRGIRMQQLSILGLKRDEMRAWLPTRRGSRKRNWEYFESLPIPLWKNQDPASWIDDKRLFKKVFERNNLPVARGGAVFTYRAAKKIYDRLGCPVITKPRDGSLARHTTVAIATEAELKEGFGRAKQLCPFVMVEEFVVGTLYRATCVDRKLIGVIELVRPKIVADGRMTIEELRQAFNQHKRFPSLTDVKDDSWFRDSIRHQGYKPADVPSAGTLIVLSEHSERPNGGYFIDITDRVPPAHRELIERGAQVCGAEVIGFDLLSQDLTDPSVRFTFIEGNTLPHIDVHHVPYEGAVQDVAGAIWDMWELEEDKGPKRSH